MITQLCDNAVEEFEECLKKLVEYNDLIIRLNKEKMLLKSTRTEVALDNISRLANENIDKMRSLLRSQIKKAVEEMRERVKEEPYDDDIDDLGAEAIANHAYKDKFEAFHYGFNEALKRVDQKWEELLAALDK